MKRLHIILGIFLFAQMGNAQQNDDYTTLWEQVEKLQDDNLTKSALELVESISKKAKQEDNKTQIIKALLHKSRYGLTLKEDAELSIVNDFKMEIDDSNGVVKNILHSYLANIYWQYFQANRHRFYNRTTTAQKVDTVDFRTWDLHTLFQEIDHNFQASLADPADLQATLIATFSTILEEEKNSSTFRPTLFDLLAHTALSFYTTSENSIQKPLEVFKINTAEMLCDAYTFSTMEIDTEKSVSLQSKALEIYRQLTAFHFGNPDLAPLTLVDIERLLYTHKHATFFKKDEILIDVLKNTADGIRKSPYAGLYLYEIAERYKEIGGLYNPRSASEHQWKLKEAVKICDEIIAKFPNNRAAEKSIALKNEITTPFVHVTYEKYIPNNTVGRLLATYKNLEHIELTAHSISRTALEKLNELYNQDEKLALISTLPIAQSWNAALTTENDHQTHSTEISIPALNNGQYIVLLQPKDSKASAYSYEVLQVTDFAVNETQTNTHQTYHVLDRNNGRPIAGATVTFHYRKNYNAPQKIETFTTNDLGNITIKKDKDTWGNINITVTKSNETAYFDNYYLGRSYNDTNESETNTCFLFTDRSIYRPGQPIYFKGIAVQQSNGHSSTITDTTLEIALFNANGQMISSQMMVTNDYGSFSGEFVLPNDGLTGRYALQIYSDDIEINGYHPFSVEEYKRPKFETDFKPISDSYKVNDSITVTGKAMAYAGSAITNAKVVYRVKRIVDLPVWYYWRRPQIQNTPQEIVQGETITDDNGNYTIHFKALPDESMNKEDLPIFNYEITADVTDINGETRSAITTVKVGYHVLNVQLLLPKVLDKETKDAKFSIKSTNLNGMPVSSTGTIKLYKLQAPTNVLRSRPWPAPDYSGFTEQEFKELYPYDAYKNEDDPAQWEKEKMVWKTNFNTANTTTITLDKLKKWRSGNYVMELETKDKFGQPVKDIAQLTLTDNDNKLADNQLFQVKTDQPKYAIGEKAKITFLTNANELDVMVYIEKDHEIVDSMLINLSTSKTLTLPVTKKDLGGFAVHYRYAYKNSFHAESLIIPVPYPNTDLQIETLTFRDKLAPGTDETWSFKIKGNKGDKVAAELLASMYDNSLDQFTTHNWSFNPFNRPTYFSRIRLNAQNSFATGSFKNYLIYPNISYSSLIFDELNWFGFNLNRTNYGFYESRKVHAQKSAPMVSSLEDSNAKLDEVIITGSGIPDSVNTIQGESEATAENSTESTQNTVQPQQVAIRKNLQETAFFFPELRTDKDGHVTFSFNSPEALTKWNVQLLAHTADLQSNIVKLSTVTQKELMVVPNAPRFLREGDIITISTKIANLTTKKLSGKATLALTNALTNTDISMDVLSESNQDISFRVDSLNNTQVSWQLKIPEGVQSVQYKIIAQTGEFSDGEQNMLPVLSNRTLVTETLPMWIRGNQSKTFTLNKLKNTDQSTTLKHHKLTLEMTSNPAWYAIQALPYLMEYPFDCNEQIFSRFYANTLASHIAISNPRIRDVFDQWANEDILMSNLEKNQELKSLLIQETPWLRDAQSEKEQKKRIGLLFNLNKMKNEEGIALRKLTQNQNSNGAWAWFKGGPDNRYITQHILTGFGQLKHLNISALNKTNNNRIIINALEYLDTEFVKEHERMLRNSSNINDDHLSIYQVHYLYMRSFFPDVATSQKVEKIRTYYVTQAQQYWQKKGLYAQGMLALALHRMGDTKTAVKILSALKENSIVRDDLGMYWKNNTSSWFWYQAPIETQALLIEAFSEVTPTDAEVLDNLKIWLLKHKQTNQWSTTKATTEAIYALLLKGNDWLSISEAVDVEIGGDPINPSTLEDVKIEAGTGYFKTSWNGNEISPKMGEVQINKKGKGIAWGALYWQYFEDLDNITGANTPLALKKKIFLKKNTPTGEVISEVKDDTLLKVGDLVRIRIELSSDRPMEFVHMKDMRAAGFEPVNVLSSYKWQDGLGYYESTKDASTNFFFDYLPKGNFVFEYDVRVNNAGNFSNGITTIESMYAPEFKSHSEGIRVQVE
ncbi:alpha-2-macroglobulin family protein [Maribacter confluentis]|uniref:Alpha-2-macroglobulin family protein n=1 Tax=Maribacter confluentis TaxID=1656093 RepID=A0ABT8RS92_9FLAO|nr:MG2 domain-containing protein [Maribacter confluentis]MDO1513565.1 alpha-2-macroglobulin family protein [Maribacter confluentis]